MSIWEQGRVHHMKKLYSSKSSNKAFVENYFPGRKYKRSRTPSRITHTKVGAYEKSDVLEFWDKTKNKPEFFIGKWKLRAILEHLEDVQKFVAS